MNTPIPRVTKTLVAPDLDGLDPVVGDRLPFVIKINSIFIALSDFSELLAGILAELNAFGAAINQLSDTAGLPITVDVENAKRGSSAYIVAITDVPVTATEIASGRRLVLMNIAPDQDRPLSDAFIAELGNDGPRWAGPLLTGLTETL